MKVLLMGCGHKRDRRVNSPGSRSKDWDSHTVTTLDNNPNCGANIVADLESPSTWPITGFAGGKLAFDSFDEVHAYEVLEHLGQQGNVAGFFYTFRNIWSVLKPNGYLCATVPHYQSLWAWGDPSHTRIINAGTLVFLDREEYNKQLGVTSMSDFRRFLDFDFRRVSVHVNQDVLSFVLQAVKPVREFKTSDHGITGR